MKRSEINQILQSAKAFMAEKQFILPPWAFWSVEDWKKNRENTTEIIDNMLGWDITDFGSGDFHKRGLFLFTIRNGKFNVDKKPYAEKIMIVEENQETPMHYHWAKMEDIINRGGGNLVIDLNNSTKDNQLANTPVILKVDGVQRTVPAGGQVVLTPGESICLESGIFHRFYGETGKGKVLVGEVSMVNDDSNDNCFHEVIGRFRYTLATGEPYHSNDWKELRKDLDIVEAYDWQIERVTLPGGGFGIVCYFYDMTERAQYEEHISLLMNEVNHRAKNLLGVVQAVARQTARSGDPETFVLRLSDRIAGLTESHDLLVKNQWRGVEVSDLARGQLSHFEDLFDTRVLFEGSPVRLNPAAAQGIGMALHELATNAGKYGALSDDYGIVRVSWTVEDSLHPRLVMTWRESGGPEVVAPDQSGFGQTVMVRMAEYSVQGTVELDYAASGLSWRLTAPLATILDVS